MKPTRLRSALPYLLLALLVVVSHGNSIANGFVWDDQAIVVESPHTRDLSHLGTVLLSPDEMKPYYRPLCRASYLLDYQLFGLRPAGFHAVNLLLHIVCVLLLFTLAKRLFDRTWPAIVPAALLAIHPVHVEAVAFISARNNLQSLMFSLVTILLCLRSQSASQHRAWWAAGSGISFFLGLASKEQAFMTLPFLGAWLVLTSEPGRRVRSLSLLLPHGLALIAYLALRTIALGGPSGSGPILPGLGERLLRNYYVVPEYVGLLLYPDKLSILRELPRDYWTLWWLGPMWLALIVIGVLRIRARSLPFLFGALWFALNLIPVIGLIPLPSTTHTIVAERFIHASAVGFWICLADVSAWLGRLVPHRALAVSGAAIAIALVARTTVRVRDWSNDLTLFASAVRAEPRSLPARFDLGTELKDRGDMEGARREWEAALAIAPDDPGTLLQLGTLAAVNGHLAEAEERFRAALKGDAGLVEASLNLGKICERTQRRDEAVAHFTRVLSNPAAPREAVEQAEQGLARLARR